ncbi:MAG: hypothetical protein M1840_001542 [Geoglossum simile]|nr:MAG: hypothetical protein M1840_001542 [Geoglossum simile]
MDHLPPVEDQALPLLKVPYLFSRFPTFAQDFRMTKRRGVDVPRLKEMLRGNVVVDSRSWSETSRFLQSWLYMGLLHEFYQYCEAVYWCQSEDVRWLDSGGATGVYIHVVSGKSAPCLLNPLTCPVLISGPQYIIKPFDEKIFMEQFVCIGRAGRRITTAKLPLLLDLWVTWNRTGPATLRAALSRSLQRSLDITKDYVTLIPGGNILEEMPPPPPIPQQVQDVLLSILILQMSLLHALCQTEHQRDGLGVDMPYILGSPLVTQRLLLAKWCPRWVSQLSMHLGSLELLYAGQLRRYGTRQDHSSCSVRECVHSHVDEANYHTKHMSYCEGCNILSIDQDEVAACFARGEYPLVVLEASKNFMGQVQPRLKVVSRREGLRYVAFSHVWSDGLGNPHSNSLPTCQVIRLAKTLLDLSSPQFSAAVLSRMSIEEKTRIARWYLLQDNGEQTILFWIDTLCIPAQRHLKKMALSKLHDTFSNAHEVVILDGELQETSWQTPILENLMRIRLTKWMTRLWTLEEAILTRPGSLCFLFNDGIFALDETMEEAKRHADSGHFLHRSIQLATFRPFGRILRIKALPPVGKITELGHLMVTRSTTKGDEALIIATSLGLDNGTLFNTPIHLRTQKLLHVQRYWPYHILFNNMSTRMTEPGYRWAPQSFLERGISPFMLGSRDLPFSLDTTGEQLDSAVIQGKDGPLRIDGGLLVALPGFRFEVAELPVGKELASLRTYFSFFDVKLRGWYSVAYTKHSGDQPWNNLQKAPQSRQRQFGIVLPVVIPPGRRCTAVLVNIYGTGTDDAVLYAELRCHLTVFRASSSPPSSPPPLPLSNTKVLPPIDEELPASRGLCEEILGDENPMPEQRLQRDVKDPDELKRAADEFRKMLCSAWGVENGQNWCIG